MGTPRFEFIPCTCPETDNKKHGHIFDNVKKENSIHLYSTDEGKNFIKSLTPGDIDESNIDSIVSCMVNFFDLKRNLVPETEADGTCYQ